ncbi:MAG TPA: histidine kinase, partial [Deltaproteobacteria bacterium]|nr:histidine kinase [Deltaproteobacteria bacterium]
SREELLTTNFQAITHPDDLDADLQLARQILPGEIAHFQREKRYLRKHGSLVWVQLTVTLVWKDDGSPDFFISVVEDITRRKEMEAALRKERDCAQRYLDTVQTIMVSLDPDGRIIMINRAGCKLLGYEEDELLGRHWFTTCLPQPLGMETVYPVFQQIMNGQMEKAEYYDNPVLCRDGSQRLITWHNSFFTDETGRITGILSSGEDITERRESMEKIHKLSLAVEQSPESIVITNLEGNIEYVNEAFLRTSGYSVEEVLGRNTRRLLSENTDSPTSADLWKAMSHGEPWQGELHNRRKDGSKYTEFAMITPIRQTDGRITHYMAIKEDITEKKRLAWELDHYRHHLEELVEIRTAELAEARTLAESANQAKSAFLANMSHEIRTPINGVLGMSELLQGTELTPEQRRFANTIQRSGEALLGLINDILDFSKIEAGKMELRSVDLSLRSTVAEMVEMLLRQAQRKGLSLTAHTDRGVPDSFIGDPLRIQQVLMNLATNAVKFTDNGEVSISVFCTEQDEERAVLRFEVRDTGIGVPVEAQSAIFDSFSQADGSATRRYGGSGLGLAIAKQLCGMMGGSIGVNSTPGKGSVFWFTIKLLKQPNGGVGAEGSISPPENTARNRDDVLSLHVLLVEDNRVNQQVAKAMLETMTCRVDVAGDGAEAVAAVKNKHYDVVLMDCQMPSMDGYEATKAIREWESERYAGRKKPNHIPIIALTAHAMKGDRERCIEAGMDDYLSKPYKLKALSEVLAPYVSKNGEELPTAHPANDGDNGGVPEASWLTGGGTPIEGSVDWSVLDRLRGLQMEGAPDVVASIINIYLVNSPTLLGQAQQALTTGDSETLRRASHTLKSSSANVGALMLSEMCRDLETLARANALANDEKQATRLFAKISDEFTRVRDALSTELVL